MTAFLEGWGTGMSHMIEVCKAVGLPEPEYGTDGGFVWITFMRPNSVTNPDTKPNTKPNTNHNTNPNTKPLYIKILLLPLHSLTTSRKWNKADQPFVPRQILMFCPHSLTSESGQFTGL